MGNGVEAMGSPRRMLLWTARLPHVGLAVILFLSASAAPSEELRGVALVIGQSAYEELAPLANPENDARAIDDLLGDLGFDVSSLRDGDQRRLSRALARFVEDAEDADVALLYYSGHGIEAGGENFLVPVDAGLDSLDDARRALVPVSQLLEELRAKVPVTIVLLDACRNSPFPPDASVRLEPSMPPVPLSVAGLSVPRGASRLAAVDGPTSADSLGEVIGFAAAPGQVALDGEPGGNSPYAAALLKHLSAGGYAFGDVMTLVSEEVWLRTHAAQTPWTNTSLRRQLSFGGVPEEEDEDETLIRVERRKLLLTISSLGDAERRQIASRANEGGVPMDALFAMLSAVGAEAPENPDELDRLLREQAGRLKSMLDQRAVLESSDAEIARLASLSETAVREGALKAAIVLNERAKARILQLSATVDDAEAQIAQRRREFAAVYEKSAQTYALASDHAAAARDYAEAFAQVERWDRELAWRYKFGEAEALMAQGHFRSDFPAQDHAIEAFRAAASFAPEAERPAEWARTQAGLAFALWARGDRTANMEDSETALAALRGASARIDRAAYPDIWAETQGRLGAVLMGLGMRELGVERLEEGAQAIRASLEVTTRERNPAEWARQQNRLGAGLAVMGMRQPGTETLRAAVEALEAALQERPHDRVPLDWAQTETNRSMTLLSIGMREGDMAVIARAERIAAGILEVYSRERTPLLWAEAKANHGAVLWQLAIHESGTDKAAAAAGAFREALEVVTRDVSPLRWAALQDNLALALKTIGERRNDVVMVEEAVAAYRLALEERRRDRVPLEWASTANNLATTLLALGYAQGKIEMLEDSANLFREVLTVNSRERIPLEWARAMNNVGLALHSLGTARQDAGPIIEAVQHFRLSLEENRRDRVPLDWGMTQLNLARALLDLGRVSGDRAALAEAKAAVQGAREVYLAAGMKQYAGNFNNMEIEIGIADLQAQVQEKARAIEQAGKTAKQ